jgi:hypothetical protein
LFTNREETLGGCVSSTWDGWIATGHNDGRLALWNEEKKRPVGGVVAVIGSVAIGFE